jgi:hypothetical protein
MPQIAARPAFAPVIACFPGLESKNFNGLVLICFCFAHATYASASPTVLPATRAAYGIAARGAGFALQPKGEFSAQIRRILHIVDSL